MSHADLIAKIAPLLPLLPRPNTDGVEQPPLCLPMFQTAQLPPGMAEEMAEELGSATADINSVFLEALFHTIETHTGHTLISHKQLAALEAAAAANEHKRNQVKHFHGDRCGQPLFQAMVTDFNTDQPRINCAVITAMATMNHNCGRRSH